MTKVFPQLSFAILSYSKTEQFLKQSHSHRFSKHYCNFRSSLCSFCVIIFLHLVFPLGVSPQKPASLTYQTAPIPTLRSSTSPSFSQRKTLVHPTSASDKWLLRGLHHRPSVKNIVEKNNSFAYPDFII